ncbi:CARDB domain-containing protein [Candidatus Bipolaricaulota bacterium]
MIDRLRSLSTMGKILSIALAIALLPWVVLAVEEPCTKLPDLWLPPDGTEGLANGGISIQTTTGDVCKGDIVTITVTIDNLSCGPAGPFDVTVYYDDTHVIGTQHVDGLPDCEYIVLTFVWDTTGVPSGEHDISACADTGGDVVELNEGNNCQTIEYDLLVRPNAPYVEVEKLAVDTGGGVVQPGDTIRYEITIWNYGCEDLEDNPGHEFTDVLPTGMDPTGQVTETSGTAALDGDTIVWDGNIPSGEYVTIKYTVDLDSDLEIGDQICNQGTVHWDSDGNGTNDSTTIRRHPRKAIRPA